MPGGLPKNLAIRVHLDGGTWDFPYLNFDSICSATKSMPFWLKWLPS
jgi:hypothetical protein